MQRRKWSAFSWKYKNNGYEKRALHDYGEIGLSKEEVNRRKYLVEEEAGRMELHGGNGGSYSTVSLQYWEVLSLSRKNIFWKTCIYAKKPVSYRTYYISESMCSTRDTWYYLVG